MKKVNAIALVSAVFALLTISGIMAFGFGNECVTPCVTDEAVAAVPLTIEAQDAVLEALVGAEGEYAAYATYDAIVNEFGNVNPFANIMAAEAKHIEALQQILDFYGVEYPVENPYLGVIDAPESLAVAAQAGVEAEIANVALYQAQLNAVQDYPDVVAVFTNLQSASQQQHLPAFQRAAARY